MTRCFRWVAALAAAGFFACSVSSPGADGPTGPAGPAGPQGSTGPAGAAGPPGTFTGTFTGATTFNGNATFNGAVGVSASLVVDGGIVLGGATKANGQASTSLTSTGQLAAPNTWAKVYDSNDTGVPATFSSGAGLTLPLNPGNVPTIYKFFCDGILTSSGAVDTRILVTVNGATTYNSSIQFVSTTQAEGEGTGIYLARTANGANTYVQIEWTFWSNQPSQSNGFFIGRGQASETPVAGGTTGLIYASTSWGGGAAPATFTTVTLTTNQSGQAFTGHCSVYASH